MTRFVFCILIISSIALNAQAGEVNVAVAANFAVPMKRIATAFAQDTGHEAVLSFGSTGALYAQIANGAPFDMFLSADEKTPVELEADGLTVRGSRFTYAIGKLALWSKQPSLVDNKGEVLRNNKFQRIAVADPALAPYGAAAYETLTQLNLLKRLKRRLVIGESIAQAHQFVATGNAQMGFVALSQVYLNGKITQGSAWIVPDNLHTPLRQDAVILARGKDNRAANALAAYLQSDKAGSIICAYGYTAANSCGV